MYLLLYVFLFVSFPSIVYLCILLAMPSWRWLVAFTTFGFGYYLVDFAAFNALPHEYLNSTNGIFARFGHYYVVFYTLVLGFIARATILRLKQKGMRKHIRNIATLSAIALYLSTPFVFSAYTSVKKAWELRAPPVACPIDTVPVQLAKETLRLPGIPNTQIMIGDGTQGDPKEERKENNVYFFSKADQRAYCHQYKNGQKNIQATSISIRPLQRGDMQDTRHQAYCTGNDTNTAALLCPHEGESPRVHFSFIGFHAQGTVNTPDIKRRENKYNHTLRHIQTLHKSKEFPAYWEDNINYYWIDDHRDMRSFDDKPIIFSCLKVITTSMSCDASYLIADGLYVYYTFTSPAEKAPQEGRKAYADIARLFEALRIDN